MGKIKDEALITPAAGDKILGSSASTTPEDGTRNFDIDAIDEYFLSKRVSVPATAGATGVAGDYAIESGYAYFCIAANTWERTVIATW